jgi:hypothetical protein
MLRHIGVSLLEKASVEEPFPSGSTARLLRRGVLFCSESSCTFVFYRPSEAAGVK